MWKWIGGCLLVCVAVIGFGIWSAYRQLSSFGSGDGTETVMIAAPPTRVFASLADADSLSGWMAEQSGIQAGHHGMLVVGDTLEGQMKVRFKVGNQRLKWTVNELKPGELLSLQLRSDRSGKLIARRQFTLSAKGDSTRVTSAVASPMLDSMRVSRGDSVRPSDAIIDMTSKLLISSLRMQSHIELQQLKARVEGHSTSPDKKLP